MDMDCVESLFSKVQWSPSQRAGKILYVLRQVPYDPIRLIDNAALAQQVGPDELWQLDFSVRRENRTSSADRLLRSEVVFWIIVSRYSVPCLSDAGWNSREFQRHARSTHLVLAKAGYDHSDLRQLGFLIV